VIGRLAGERNAKAFEAFIAERERRQDWDDYVTPDRSRLQRGKIVKVCGFSRSVLHQNRIVVGRLLQLENELRERSILESINEENKDDLLEFEEGRDERIQNLENRTERLESSIDDLRRSLEGIEQKISEILSI
jgi:hypothetical protein